MHWRSYPSWANNGGARLTNIRDPANQPTAYPEKWAPNQELARVGCQACRPGKASLLHTEKGIVRGAAG